MGLIGISVFILAIFQEWELVIHAETLPDNQGEKKAKRQGLTRLTPQKARGSLIIVDRTYK